MYHWASIILLVLPLVACTAPEQRSAGATDTPEKTGAATDSAESETERALAEYLKENFGVPGLETSWYGNIVKVEISGDTAIAHTNLDAAPQAASGVCSALSGFVFGNQNNDLGLAKVHVMGTQGPLIQRNSPADSCR